VRYGLGLEVKQITFQPPLVGYIKNTQCWTVK